MNQSIKPAFLWQRVLAHNIDLLFVLIPLMLVFYFWQPPGSLTLIGTVWYLLFHIVCELLWKTTPGKKLTSLSVLTYNHLDLTKTQIVSRNLLKIVSAGLLGIGIVMMFFHAKRKSLHDILSKTIVVTR